MTEMILQSFYTVIFRLPLAGQKETVKENLFPYFFSIHYPTRITWTLHDTKISILKR